MDWLTLLFTFRCTSVFLLLSCFWLVEELPVTSQLYLSCSSSGLQTLSIWKELDSDLSLQIPVLPDWGRWELNKQTKKSNYEQIQASFVLSHGTKNSVGFIFQPFSSSAWLLKCKKSYLLEQNLLKNSVPFSSFTRQALSSFTSPQYECNTQVKVFPEDAFRPAEHWKNLRDRFCVLLQKHCPGEDRIK